MNGWRKVTEFGGRLTIVLLMLGLPIAGSALGPHERAEVIAVSAWRGVAAHPAGDVTSPLGVGGTTATDLTSFAAEFNTVRKAHHLRLIPLAHFRYDPCMERRLFWMAEDPSTNPASAWGHIGSKRSDGVPSVGCDGNLAGGLNNTGKTVADKWWASVPHRTSLYKPFYTASLTKVCIYFAMSHGGVPDEPTAFTRSAARWSQC